jgi:hypothetical protein
LIVDGRIGDAGLEDRKEYFMNALSKLVPLQYVWLAERRQTEAQMACVNQFMPLVGRSRTRVTVRKMLSDEV